VSSSSASLPWHAGNHGSWRGALSPLPPAGSCSMPATTVVGGVRCHPFRQLTLLSSVNLAYITRGPSAAGAVHRRSGQLLRCTAPSVVVVVSWCQFTTGGPSVSMSWCRAPSRAHDQMVVNCLAVAVLSCSCALSDGRSGLSFVSHSPKSLSRQAPALYRRG
jgi:hypothetical protein